MKKLIILLYILFAVSNIIFAQQDSTEEIEFDEDLQDSLDYEREQKPHLIWDINYLSDIVYNGRRLDSLPQWGVNLSLKYKMKHGFSVIYDGAIWSDAKRPYAFTNWGIEKVFSITDNFEISTSFNRFFYTNGTRAEKNYFNKSFDVSVGYSLGDFYIGWYGAYMWGTAKTFYHNPSLAWTYQKWLGDKNHVKWKCTPELDASYGRGDAAARAISIKQNANGKAAKKNPNGNPRLSKDAAYVGILCYTINLENDFIYKDHTFSLLLSANKPVGPSTDGKWLYYFGLEWKKNIYFK